MAGRLPIVIVEGEEYFLDKRLGQIRNVDNPHDFRPIPIDVVTHRKADVLSMLCPTCSTELDSNLYIGDHMPVPTSNGVHDIPNSEQTCPCCETKLKVVAKVSKTLHFKEVLS